jgi:hypothetical protein
MNTAGNSVTNFSPNYTVEGNTYIVWGTDGEYPGYIVTAASQETRVSEIDIENGTGFTVIVILLNDGLDVDLTVIDDTSVTPPIIGSIVTLSSPFGSIPMLMVKEKTDQARKREGMRTFNFKSFNAISGVH